MSNTPEFRLSQDDLKRLVNSCKPQTDLSDAVKDLLLAHYEVERLQSEVQQLTEQRDAQAADIRGWLVVKSQLTLERDSCKRALKTAIAAQGEQFKLREKAESERDALAKQLQERDDVSDEAIRALGKDLEFRIDTINDQVKRIEKLESALKEYARDVNWFDHVVDGEIYDDWVGEGRGPDLAQSVLGVGKER